MDSRAFPRKHFVLAGLLGLGLCSFVLADLLYIEDSSEPAEETAALAPPGIAPRAIADAPLPEIAGEPPAPQHTVTHRQVAPGDNLAVIFRRQGIAAAELHRVLASKPLGPRLRRIYPGHDLTFTLGEDNSLLKLEYSPGPLQTLAFERAGDGFVGREVTQEPERVVAYKHATIDHSLFVSSQRAGFDDSLTMRLAQIFQWDIDFVLDIRRGDEFYVLYEELYLNDKFIGYGDILAAEFTNQGDSFQAVWYSDDNTEGYFTPTGKSMRKAFLRAPVQFSRISSNFNLRRVHPLFKRTMPHRGIDYAAPRGTPIMASGDGTVTTAGRTNANGNYVVIKHGEQFVTKYLHLSKFARSIRKGARVKQGQTIGYVGATGWANAPHLHYEFLVSGVHKNPRTVSLPDAAPIQNDARPAFEYQAQPLIALLNGYKQQIQLAFRDLPAE
tara:strand:+ start:1969 stop:3294 length:1326 start_codon:yes stop_codon:yes gene_type:complete